MRRLLVLGALSAALVLQGCSSRPREFTPTLAVATADRAAFDADVETCRELLVAGKLDKSGRVGSAAAGVATGAGVLAGGATAASSAGMFAGAAIASATVIAIPFVALGSAWGMSKIKRNKKEKAIQVAMAGCLEQRGHKILGWTKAPKRSRAAKQAMK